MIRNFINVYKEAFQVWIRRRMRPLKYDEAEEKKMFFAKCYMLTGLLAAGFVIYKTLTGINDSSKYPTGLDVAKLIKTTDTVRVIKLSGFEKVDDYNITSDKSTSEDSVEKQ